MSDRLTELHRRHANAEAGGGLKNAKPASITKENSPPANASTSSSTKAPSKSSTNSSAIVAAISAWTNRSSTATASSPDTGWCMAAPPTSSRRISRSSAVLTRNQRQENRHDHGPRSQDRSPRHRPQRFRRRPHPGRRRVSWRVRGHLPPQYSVQRRHPANLRHHGPLRRRSRLLARPHRLRFHGRQNQLHVRYRPRRDKDRYPRRRDQGNPGWRDHAQLRQRRGAFSSTQRHGMPANDPRADVVPAAEQSRRRPRAPIGRSGGPAGRGSIRSCPPNPISPTTSRT